MEKKPLPTEVTEIFREYGKLGGSKGGKRRAAALTAEQRSAIARKAALARWGKRKKAKGKKAGK